MRSYELTAQGGLFQKGIGSKETVIHRLGRLGRFGKSLPIIGAFPVTLFYFTPLETRPHFSFVHFIRESVRRVSRGFLLSIGITPLGF